MLLAKNKSARMVRPRLCLPPICGEASRAGANGRRAPFCALALGVMAVLLSSAAVCVADGEDRTETRAAASTIIELPIEKDAAAIFIRACVDTPAGNSRYRPQPWTFLLDTGSSHCVIDASHRASLGASLGTVKELSADDGSVVETFAPADIHVGGHRLRPRRRFACVDLKRVSGLIGEHLDGVLGMDALRDSVVDIDFIECRLRFQSATPSDEDHRVPIVWKYGGCPFIEGTFSGGAKVDLLVDTGALEDFAGTLSRDVFENLCKANALMPIEQTERSQLSTNRNTFRSRFGRASMFSVGRHAHADLIFATHPRLNSIGLGYLSRYRVTFDFPNDAMYLWPSRSFSKQDQYRDFTSFLISRRDGRVTVFATVKPCVDNRIRPGDELVTINGQPVAEMTIVGLRRTIAREPLQRLQLRRDGGTRHEEFDFREQAVK